MGVTYTQAAATALAALPAADARRIRAAIQQVADAHPHRLSFVTELAGRPGVWRLRKGDYRAVYRMTAALLTVEAVGHRKDIYS